MSVSTQTQDAETQSTRRLLALHVIRLKGTASSDVVGEISGLELPVVEEELRAAERDGLAQLRTGRLSGYRLTVDGKQVHRRLLDEDAEHPRRRVGLERAYAGFLPLNGTLKEICGRWQLRPDGSINDHADDRYDAEVVGELRRLEQVASADLRAAAVDCARLGVYALRLHESLRRVEAGDRDAFARPMAHSFHDAWMELHQDLLLSLGRERDAADGH